ncbi:MAG: CAP domain-containing protein [bacterium]|nr:CAP domain-containing protein [bacterium]
MNQKIETSKGARRIHDYFFPHERNKYKPHFFSLWSLGVILLGIVVLHAIYFVEVRYVFKQTDFLAAVLPGVLTSLTNNDRANEALPPVIHDPELARAAQLAVNDMATNGYFAHNSPDGKTPWYWLQQVGYSYRYAGQNLAVNFSDSRDVQNGWLNSPTHRANILKREYTRIGIAVAVGTYKGKESTFVVQYFATPVSAAQSAAPSSTAAVDDPQARETEPQRITSQPTPKPSVLSATDDQVTTMITPAATATPVVDASTPVPAIEIGAPEESSYFAHIATSPHRVLIVLLSCLLILTITALALGTGMHLRHQYVEVMGGGLALFIIILSVLLYQVSRENTVEISEGAGSFQEQASLNLE